MRRNIYFIGLMAVGKSTIGRLLAESLGWEFLDSDHVIEERAGAPVAWIFDVEGEQGFRDREQAVIDELTRREGIVLATGGGAVLRTANRTALAGRGCVVHLDSSVDRLVERTCRDRKRPILQVGDRRETLSRLLEDRTPLYAEIADYRFFTDSQGARALARKIERRLQDDGVIA